MNGSIIIARPISECLNCFRQGEILASCEINCTLLQLLNRLKAFLPIVKKKYHKIAGRKTITKLREWGDDGLRVGMVSSSLHVQPNKSDFRGVMSTISPSDNCEFILPLKILILLINYGVIIRNNYM